MSISKTEVIKSLIWKWLERCSVQVVTFIVTIILARILVPEDYGLIALVLVFVNLSNVIVDGGLNMALVQKKEADNVDFSTIFYTNLLLAMFLYVLLFLSSGFIAQFYEKPELVYVIRVIGVSLFFYAISSIQKAFLSRHLLFKKLFYSSLGAVLLSGVISICMAKMRYGVWALVVQNLTVQITITVIMWFTVNWKPQLVFSYERFKTLYNYGWKIFVTNFLINIFIDIRSLIIGKVYNPSSLGFFDRGKQFPALIIENINASIQAVLFPVLSKEQDDVQKVKLMVKRSIRMNAFIVFPLIICLLVIAEPLVLSLLTAKWLGTVVYVRIFCLAYLLMPMQVVNVQAIQSLGYSGTTLKLESLKKTIELVIIMITVTISVEAVAWGIVLYNAISLFINSKPNKKLLDYGIKEQIFDVAPILLISMIMGVMTYLISFFHLSPWATLCAQLLVAVLTYFFVSAACQLEEFLYIKKIVLPYLHRDDSTRD